MKRLIGLAAALAWLTITAHAAEPVVSKKLVQVKVRVVEMSREAALESGVVTLRCLAAYDMGRLKFCVRQAQSGAIDEVLQQLSKDGRANILATQDLDIPDGETASYKLLALAPFDLVMDNAKQDTFPFESKYAGMLGAVIDFSSPVMDEKGRITLDFSVQSNTVNNKVIDGQIIGILVVERNETKLRVVSGETYSVRDFITQDERQTLAALSGMQPVDLVGPFFGPPTPDWFCFLVVTVTAVDDPS